MPIMKLCETKFKALREQLTLYDEIVKKISLQTNIDLSMKEFIEDGF
jgi:hypothetical protein